MWEHIYAPVNSPVINLKAPILLIRTKTPTWTSFKGDADLANSPALKKHAAEVMNTVANIIPQ